MRAHHIADCYNKTLDIYLRVVLKIVIKLCDCDIKHTRELFTGTM